MDIVIRSCDDISFYVGKRRKRWTYGKLEIYCQKITFKESLKTPSNEVVEVSIPFSDVVKINKSTTTFIFGAIVLTSKNGTDYWFSSFRDRESAFKIMKHFQQNVREGTKRNVLLSGQGVSQRTEMGTKLLSVTQDSMSSLAGSCVMLNEQGEQIDRSGYKMLNIHNDLGVATQLTTGLEAWIGRWSLPKEYTIIKPVVIGTNEIPEVYDYEVLFTNIESGKMCQQEDRVIQISNMNIKVLNMNQKVMHQLEWSFVSKIRVISPWEMMVICYQIGKPDVVFSFVSSMLVDILSKLQSYAKHKMEYDSHQLEKAGCSDHKVQPSSKDDRLFCETQNADREDITSRSRSQVSRSGEGSVDQQQVLQEKEVVSKEEIEELTSNLHQLKSMMLAAGEETDIQNEKLDNLNQSVDEANMKLESVTKRINKLM